MQLIEWLCHNTDLGSHWGEERETLGACREILAPAKGHSSPWGLHTGLSIPLLLPLTAASNTSLGVKQHICQSAACALTAMDSPALQKTGHSSQDRGLFPIFSLNASLLLLGQRKVGKQSPC